jgi:hypothetical protein
MKRVSKLTLIAIFSVAALAAVTPAQSKPVVLSGEELKRVVPAGFYYAGQTAETQMRNSAAARFGDERHVIVGLVDTSGYSTDISGVYEGFLIVDIPVRVGNRRLAVGAYGFGFSKDAINIFDLGAKKILSVPATFDSEMKRPRPVMIVGGETGIRLYKGKSYVVITPQTPVKSTVKPGGTN